MNIWFVNHYAYAPDQSAGTRHYGLSRELIKMGHRPLVIASSFYHKARTETRLKTGEAFRKIDVGGVPFVYLRTSPYGTGLVGRVRNMLEFALAVKRGTGLESEAPPDAVVGSMPSPFAALAATYLAKKHRAMFLAEIRDYWSESIVELGGHGRFNPFVAAVRYSESAAIRRSSKVISLFPDPSKDYFRRNGTREKFVCIPNGVSFEDLPELEAFEHTWDEGPFVLIFAGAHSAYSDLGTLLEAAALLEQQGVSRKDLIIRLIGDGPAKPSLMDMAKTRGLEIVEFCDAVPKSEIYKEISRAHAGLMIAKKLQVYEGGISPNKLWDYMACARPVLFAMSTPHNVVAATESGVSVEAEDATALKDTILDLMRRPRAELRAMGLRGREYVRENNGYRALAERLVSVIGEAGRSP